MGKQGPGSSVNPPVVQDKGEWPSVKYLWQACRRFAPIPGRELVIPDASARVPQLTPAVALSNPGPTGPLTFRH
jgi:hypothetical protein